MPSIAVTGNDRDPGMNSEPGLGGRGLTVWQKGDYPARFLVADELAYRCFRRQAQSSMPIT
jgi:hypothetical protein